MLEDASKMFPYDISLDVSKRDGIYIFHNKGNSLVQGGVYEPKTQHALMVLVFLDKLRNKSTVLTDMGANIGLHTFFLKSRYKDLNIIAFDPSPASWRYLELSINYNNISSIRVEKIALSDKNGLLDFYSWGHESSGDSLKDTGRVPNVKPKIIQVPAKRLDDIKDLPSITVMKIDCEGAELSILKGASKTLAKNRPLIVLESNSINRKAFNVTTEDIFNLIRKMNYSLYSLYLEPLDACKFEVSQQENEENYIMLPNEFLASKKDD